MKAIKYHAIDKNIIQEGRVFKFKVFIASESKKKMYSFKERGEVITKEDVIIAIDTQDILYVEDSEYLEYEEFKNSSSTIKKNISFNEKSALIYENASNILNNLFNAPEVSGNYEASKGVVNNIVETILDDEFSIKSLISIATHNYYTHTHSINVAIYALSLGSYLKLKPKELSELGEAALLHDLGKSKIDANIINKDGKLTDLEYEEVKKHPALGYTLGLKIGIKNRKILEGIRHHHEKMDGTGYPFFMRGERIPYYARIICICDIFDALTSRRSYQEPMSSFEALSIMKVKMKNELDIKLVNQMIGMFR